MLRLTSSKNGAPHLNARLPERYRTIDMKKLLRSVRANKLDTHRHRKDILIVCKCKSWISACCLLEENAQPVTIRCFIIENYDSPTYLKIVFSIGITVTKACVWLCRITV